VTRIEHKGTNIEFTFESPISAELKIDQSLAHNGVCLTVTEMGNNWHKVVAIQETLNRTNLGELKIGDLVNLERAMKPDGRLDGHIVQGHVDCTGKCIEKIDQNGSWLFGFEFPAAPHHILVDKGSVCINGVSLTVVNPTDTQFYVAIIPYTYEHTNFKSLVPGSTINMEFDILGKYVTKLLSRSGQI
jgi:riboflavin synthase